MKINPLAIVTVFTGTALGGAFGNAWLGAAISGAFVIISTIAERRR